MPVQNFEWVKITLNSGRKFFMRDFQFGEKVLNQVGQYGLRFFQPNSDLFFAIHNESADKIMLKEVANFGFNPNFVETTDIVRDKTVEIVRN